MSDREALLEDAKKIVTHDRNDDYGEPEDNFKKIAEMWTAYLGHKYEFTPIDVSMMMTLLKVARIGSGSPTFDSFVDIAGYAACGGEIFIKEEP